MPIAKPRSKTDGVLFNIPNVLTAARVLMIPIFMVVRYMPMPWSNLLSSVIFAFACLTDYVDGYLARKLNQTSAFGAFLDPVADKLMVSSALIVLTGAAGSALVGIPAAIIIGREILVSAVREWMASMGERDAVAVSFAGKMKTACQMVSLVILLAVEWPHTFSISDPSSFITPFGIGMVLLQLATVLTLSSMWGYLKAAWRVLRKSS
eukprot:CAMPEP_0196665962 /NCGR_PEP_ID=MMETSP1086-20130531/63224_1 /TAXON_ID=77921 /ORGANISM="Cyanoptyche  gloeocystis , Strain SAG4.97" /LENGTH=207 /DNA_ID=CAMNT_0042002979 /DNA_START=276 /DNA_END=899 /DNA_ORIENTATION=-